MKKMLAAAAVLFTLTTGCASFTPCPDSLYSIESKPYVANVYTCLHKSQDYCKALRAAGYEAYVVVGTVTWDERDHAWNEIVFEGQIYWVDATTESGVYPASSFTDRTVIESTYASPDYLVRK